MSRYFVDEGPSEAAGASAMKVSSENVFTIGKDDIYKSKKIQFIKEMSKKKKNERDDDDSGLHDGPRRKKKRKKGQDKFPGKAPVDPDALDRHSLGPGVDTSRLKTKFKRKEAKRREKNAEFAQELSARAELLLDEEAGELQGDETHQFTANISQTQIRKALLEDDDTITASKGFELKLKQFGPYKVDYSRNGKYLSIGGRRGHVAAFDWISKKLLCEINVQESVHDIQWLHTHNMFAVAQKKWTYIYDNQGIELHCLKKLDNVLSMEFLPYHFLLATGSERSFMSWVDISVGQLVAQFPTRLGPLSVMAQNPSNAVVMAGHSKGIVTMWTPNMKEPVAKLLVHRQPVRSIAVDRGGIYFATAGADRTLKIWDARKFGCVQNYSLNGVADKLVFSGRGLLAASLGRRVEIFKDCCTQPVEYPYMKHEVHSQISDIAFAPFEDNLGIGHAGGFSSIIVPGSGEPNFDALEANPFQTKKQKREAEVKALLEKIPSELISLDPNQIAGVNIEKVAEELDADGKKLHIKPKNIDFEPRYKMKGKGGTAKQFHIKRTVVEEMRFRNLKKDLDKQEARESRVGATKRKKEEVSLLDRLK